MSKKISEREMQDEGYAKVGAWAWENRVATVEDLAALDPAVVLQTRYVEQPKPRAYFLWPDRGWIPVDAYTYGLDENDVVVPDCWEK